MRRPGARGKPNYVPRVDPELFVCGMVVFRVWLLADCGSTDAVAVKNHGSNQLSNEEIEKLSCALEEMATAGVISHELEKKMCDKLAHCDTHLLMTWTVYQCNGNEKRFLQSIRDMP